MDHGITAISSIVADLNCIRCGGDGAVVLYPKCVAVASGIDLHRAADRDYLQGHIGPKQLGKKGSLDEQQRKHAAARHCAAKGSDALRVSDPRSFFPGPGLTAQASQSDRQSQCDSHPRSFKTSSVSARAANRLGAHLKLQCLRWRLPELRFEHYCGPFDPSEGQSCEPIAGSRTLGLVSFSPPWWTLLALTMDVVRDNRRYQPPPAWL
ncbi:hypothetical protein PC128_g18636 [Phytophthora cactorum]|nr:hypothetical protein PC128_g18636 [Phytophthora cactorum]KAG4048140.1 hypothetical protein PC123_g16534 [Phytophthora cactorum]